MVGGPRVFLETGRASVSTPAPRLSFCGWHLAQTHRPLALYRQHQAYPGPPTFCTPLALDAFTASGCGLSPVVYGLGQAAYK